MKNRPASFLLGTAMAVMSITIVFTACGKTPDVAAAPPAMAAASGNVADADVTTGVKTALLADPMLKAFDIGVVVLKGDVRLIGRIDTQAQIDEAMKVARAVEGVHSIHDELTLQK